MANVVTCELAGDSLTNWLSTATQVQKDALCAAWPCDEIVVAADSTGFPATGDPNKLYVASDDDAIYQWDTATSSYQLIGRAGTKWFTGTEDPPTEPVPGALAGDFYLSTVSGNYYQLEQNG